MLVIGALGQLTALFQDDNSTVYLVKRDKLHQVIQLAIVAHATILLVEVSQVASTRHRHLSCHLEVIQRANHSHLCAQWQRTIDKLSSCLSTLVAKELGIIGLDNEVHLGIIHLLPHIDRTIYLYGLAVACHETNMIQLQQTSLIDDAIRRQTEGHVASLVPDGSRIKPYRSM